LALFPFETDFTPVEQRLLPALQRLKAAQASPLQLSALLLRGLGKGAAMPGIGDCLARMGLARPSDLSEHLYVALLRGALRQ
jgi:hypothetical protein